VDQSEGVERFVPRLPRRALVLDAREPRHRVLCQGRNRRGRVRRAARPRRQVYASALLAAGRLYYVTRSGKIFVLAAGPQFEQLAVNDLSDRGVFNGSPAVAGNRLLLRSDKFVYCIGR